MKRLLTINILVVIVLNTFAQYDKGQLIERINKTAAATTSLQCSFTQTKELSLLQEKMVSEGRMSYSNGKLRWEYITPYSYCFVLNGSKVMLSSTSRKDIIDIKNNKMFEEIARIMMSSITGECLNSHSDFNIDIIDEDGRLAARLCPKKKQFKQAFSEITLYFNRNYTMIEKIVMTEKSGDNTIIELKDTKINEAVEESLFIVD